MDKAMAQFDMRTYFHIAAYLMGIVAVGSTYSAIVMWRLMDLGAKVSRVAGILFNILLVVLFIYLMYMQPKKSDVEDAQSKMKGFMEDLEKDES